MGTHGQTVPTFADIRCRISSDLLQALSDSCGYYAIRSPFKTRLRTTEPFLKEFVN